RATAANIRNAFFIKPLRGPSTLGRYTRSKRVSAMRADRELKLEQQLVRVLPDRIVGPAVLRADLAELARPVRDHERSAGVDERRVVGVTASVEARTREPAARELI